MNYCFDKYVIINKFKKVVKQNKAYIKRIMTESQIPKVVPNQIKIKKMNKLQKRKKEYLTLSLKVWEIHSFSSVICTSGGRNDYEEEEW